MGLPYSTQIVDTISETLGLGNVVGPDNKIHHIYPQKDEGDIVDEAFYMGHSELKGFFFPRFHNLAGVRRSGGFRVKKVPLLKVVGGNYEGIHPEYAVLPQSSFVPTKKDPAFDGFIFAPGMFMSRSVVIPTELIINNERYCCVNLKGATFPLVPGNEPGKELIYHSSQLLRGACFLGNCDFSYELGKIFRKSLGKPDNYILGVLALPKIEESPEPLGVLIRAQKSDLTCANFRDFDSLYEAVGMTKKEYLVWFQTNAVKDLMLSLEIGYLNETPHEQNRLLTGYMKDYQDYEKLNKKNWNPLLATNIIAIWNQLWVRGASYDKITEIFSEIIGKNVKSKKDVFLALNPKVKEVLKKNSQVSEDFTI
jgi:hypothetical protein